YLLHRNNDWKQVKETVWNLHAKTGSDSTVTSLQVQQVVFSLDSVHGRDVVPESITFAINELSDAVSNVTNHLPHSLQSASGRNFGTSCYRPSSGVEFLSTEAPVPCFTDEVVNGRSIHQTLAFVPGLKDEFTPALNRVLKASVGDDGVQFEVETKQSETISEMKNSKWVAYAARALVVRFWDLTKKADSLDIMLILAGYILMHVTFFLLFTRSRRLGSNFSLPSSILVP
ncbi:hypothetical protein MPER_03765, partial [Moniliophthora perniciosa FA553]